MKRRALPAVGKKKAWANVMIGTLEEVTYVAINPTTFSRSLVDLGLLVHSGCHGRNRDGEHDARNSNDGRSESHDETVFFTDLNRGVFLG